MSHYIGKVGSEGVYTTVLSFISPLLEQSGYTALHYAAFAEKKECLTLLVSEYHVNPNETDNVSSSNITRPT